MKTKKVYTVFGSEDGILGVYSSKVKAFKRAEVYIRNGGGVPVRSSWRVEEKEGSTYANIEDHFINDYLEGTSDVQTSSGG